jgi:hypothetical protein
MFEREEGKKLTVWQKSRRRSGVTTKGKKKRNRGVERRVIIVEVLRKRNRKMSKRKGKG